MSGIDWPTAAVLENAPMKHLSKMALAWGVVAIGLAACNIAGKCRLQFLLQVLVHSPLGMLLHTRIDGCKNLQAISINIIRFTIGLCIDIITLRVFLLQ